MMIVLLLIIAINFVVIYIIFSDEIKDRQGP